MVDGLVSREGDRRASCDGDGAGASSSCSADVASEVVIRERSYGRVVVGVGSYILILRSLHAVCCELLEDI